jgi:hypothetical protein
MAAGEPERVPAPPGTASDAAGGAAGGAVRVATDAAAGGSAADAAADPLTCEGCGDAMRAGQWVVQFLDGGKCCHLDCWRDPGSPRMAAKLAGLKTSEEAMVRVILTVQARDLEDIDCQLPTIAVVEMSKNLKVARRELRAAREEGEKQREQVLQLRQEICSANEEMARERLVSHGRSAAIDAAFAQRQAARAEAEKERTERLKWAEKVELAFAQLDEKHKE